MKAVSGDVDLEMSDGAAFIPKGAIMIKTTKTQKFSPEYFNQLGTGYLPSHLGIIVTELVEGRITVEFDVRKCLTTPTGFLHAGSIVSLADSAAGYGCLAHLPEKAVSFTTIELKSNHLGTTLEGAVQCVAKPVHLGKQTQVWDAEVTSKQSGKTIALFRCTQMILYPKGVS
jgi:1,4-dihydroxy-2-naphthoyl-CoA hydrolase